MKEFISNPSFEDQPTGEAVIPVKPDVDRSLKIYFSDGTVNTLDREAHVQDLLADRGRNLQGDPVSGAAWFNALGQPYSTTPAEVSLGLDEQLEVIDGMIQAYSPTPLEQPHNKYQ